MSTMHFTRRPPRPPAGPGGAPGAAPDQHTVELRRLIVTLPSRLALAAGAWLLIAPFALTYSTAGHGFRAYWNDVVVGIAVIAVAALRIAQPKRTAALATILAIGGGWLAVAPYVLAFATDAGAPRAAANDTVVGVLLVALAALGRILERRLPVPVGS